MSTSGNDDLNENEQANSNVIKNESNIYEDEINLIDYIRIVWKWKWFIFIASILPPLVVGLVIFIWPRDYKIAFTYDMELNEKALKVLEDTFYNTENLETLAEKLQASIYNEDDKRIIAEVETTGSLTTSISFEISPLYFKAIETSKAINLVEMQKFNEARGSLLVMRVGSNSRKNIREIASVYRNNFEQIIPLYTEKKELNNKIISIKEEMAVIEETRYTLNLELERKKSTLEKLKNLSTEDLSRLPSDIVLQFDNVGGNSAFLPLPYQIQAAETQIINLEEQIRTNSENYDYDAHLLNLNEKFFGYVKKAIPSYYSIVNFHSFLTSTLAEYNQNNQPLLDYLKAYIKRIENKMSNAMPLVEKPKVYSVAKGTVKKSAIVFAIALMLSLFAAFLLEGLKKS